MCCGQRQLTNLAKAPWGPPPQAYKRSCDSFNKLGPHSAFVSTTAFRPRRLRAVSTCAWLGMRWLATENQMHWSSHRVTSRARPRAHRHTTAPLHAAPCIAACDLCWWARRRQRPPTQGSTPSGRQWHVNKQQHCTRGRRHSCQPLAPQAWVLLLQPGQSTRMAAGTLPRWLASSP